MASSFDVPGYFYPNACLGEFLLVEKAALLQIVGGDKLIIPFC